MSDTTIPNGEEQLKNIMANEKNGTNGADPCDPEKENEGDVNRDLHSDPLQDLIHYNWTFRSK